MQPHLEVCHLTKTFGSKTIYHDVSFSFVPGCYVVVGPNGTGKSVLMELLAGVSSQDSGSICLHGVGCSSSLEYKRKLTYIPGLPSFFPSATGASFLKFIGSTKLDTNDSVHINKMIDGFCLGPHLSTRFDAMSMGTQKKLFLTTLAMGNSKLIIMDEPTNALDDASNTFFAKMVSELSQHAIVIIATHDQNLLDSVDHVVIKLENIPTTKLIQYKQAVSC
jgi:heme-transporting ATPase